MRYFYSLFIFVLAGLLFVARPAQAAGVTYTVCASGCDFTTLTAALTHPGIFNDTVQMTAGYVFVPGSEATSLYVPNNITVEALPGADAFGDAAEAVRDFGYGSNTVMQNITFENVAFDASGQNNVKWLNNTISGAAESILVLTSTTNAEISGNIGLQNVRLQTADDVVISNNTMHCRFGSSCISASIAGGAPDYHLSASISSNVDITNNQIINYTVNSFGDYINLTAGENINITGNTISSAVTVNDGYITMASFSNTEVYLAHNYFIFPDKVVAASNGTWGINLRVGDGDMAIVAEHNTMIMRDGTGNMLPSSSCTGMYDDGSHANPTVTYEFRYNLCYSPSTEPGGEGTGVNLTYTLGTIDFTFTNSYNGFANHQTLISDSTSTYTALAGTTRTDDPLLRLENVSTTDDAYPVPMSRYMDVNGALDIGAYSAARATTYTIDDNCSVDYTTCHSTDIQLLNKVLRDGDTATIGAGTYAPITLNGGLNNVTINGAGATTIFDANDTGSAVTLNGVSNSQINNIKVQDTSIITTTTYAITRSQFAQGATTYDQGALIGLPNGVLVMVAQPSSNTCASDFWDADGKDVTTYVGAATENWNVYLVSYLGIKLTIFAPNNILSDADDILGCANPGEVTVEHFIPSIYTVSGGNFTYNTAAAATAGISVKPGDTNPPALTRTDISTNNAGIMVLSGSGNRFTGVTVEDNSYGAVFAGTTSDNCFIESTFTNNSLYDVRSTSTGNNGVEDSQYTLAKLQATTSGNVNVYYTAHATITDGSTSSPLAGVTVTIKDATNAVVETLTTDGTGVTPQSTPLLAVVISQGSTHTLTTGGKNPFMLTGTLAEYSANSASFTLSSANQGVALQLFPIPQNVGGGGYVSPQTTGLVPKIVVSQQNSVQPSGAVRLSYEVLNIGTAPLSRLAVEDTVCNGSLQYLSGDVGDTQLSPGGTWVYGCEKLLKESVRNVVSATAYYGDTSVQAMSEADIVVAVAQEVRPAIRVQAQTTVSPIVSGANIATTYTVTNIGTVALGAVGVRDNKCSSVTGHQGDLNMNSLLDLFEVWIFNCRTTIAADAFRVITAQGSANGITVSGYTSGVVPVNVPASAVLEPNIGYYTVLAGDSLRSIAQRLYADPEQWRRLVELNSAQYTILGVNPEAIQPGWKLKYDQPRQYSYELITQSPYPAVLAPGAVVNVWIEVKNTSTTAWFRDGNTPVRLGTGSKFGNAAQRRDYTSEFKSNNWLSLNRPVATLHQIVEPGWHTRFQFDIKAPALPGVYRAYFTPVVDGISWMKDRGIYWEIIVR